MQLTLRYTTTAQRPACAAFLRGPDPGAWLRELGRWNVAPEQLACYVVPQSIRNLRAAGLLVVFKEGPMPTDCLEPYGVVANRLYVPVTAELWPETTPAELSSMLLWPRQLLHPSIGMVGFGAADEVALLDLLDTPAPRATRWDLAHPGLPARPRLQTIRVQSRPPADLLESMRETIGTEPLTELTKKEKEQDTPVQKALDYLKEGALKTGLRVVQGVGGALAGLADMRTTHSAGAGGADNAGPGLLQKLENWLAGNLANLEQKRQGEIERLLRLFGDNPEEALKYAIPLGGPYLNRGAAPPSARLGSRNTTFDLRRLGGGQRVDSWDLGPYEHQLRAQYQRAAQQELAAGHCKKAAYIYAQLLGDYHSAAKALEQGQFYREAATLHKEHLHNSVAAAGCLERGGLLLEAAELYTTLNHHEKAGDLYDQLQQPGAAAQQYELGAAGFLTQENYSEAARLLHRKLHTSGRAKAALLQGWHNSRQPETCLRHYFEVVAADSAEEVSAHVRELYREHTPATRRAAFLHVLVSVKERYSTIPDFVATSREVAYEIISQEAQVGNQKLLSLLPNFLPNDPLIAADCSRFLTTQAAGPKPSVPSTPKTAAWQLTPEVTWYSATAHRNQFLALGRRDNHLHLARGNWYGHIEYYSWPDVLSAHSQPVLYADAFHTTNIILFAPHQTGFATQYLARNKHFEEALCIFSPNLPSNVMGVGMLPDNVVVTLLPDGAALQRRHYTMQGGLIQTVPCPTPEGVVDGVKGYGAAPIFARGQQYYTYLNEYLLKVAPDDTVQLEHLYEGSVGDLVISPYQASPLFAAVTSKDICLISNLGKEEEHILLDTDPQDDLLCFVGTGQLVVAGGRAAALYAATKASKKPLQTYTSASRIVAVLPTLDRQRFALLDTTGLITQYAIPSE
ncbi:hypothetical protein K3G63_09655 [Hymenobacter sp. HSC-4F20]|uniref:hypothetical protein n=1 Tax=Hymenobacter sp. HSC-4F20 TaxID=2864135 RepID=UPI001C736556|nr:hypothetical protein [Hymenobacter sp. HSC-4F20]MBX0290703.1 hypothetical protein [Hymenobacter sp. HSC-4F20]